MSKREADSVRSLAASHPFEDLASELSTREGASMTGGDLGYVSREQVGMLADRVFSAREGNLIGPVEVAGRYAILKVGDRQAARDAGLEEVRDLINERLRPILERRRLVEIVKKRRGHTDVTITWDILYSAPLPSNLNE
jgi:parvulin-like peptidyl-prolyl isomerase